MDPSTEVSAQPAIDEGIDINPVDIAAPLSVPQRLARIESTLNIE